MKSDSCILQTVFFQRKRLWRYLLRLFVLAALLVSLNHTWQYGKLTQGFDFLEKWQIGQRFAGADAGSIYSARFLDLHISSPFLYTLVSLLSSGDFAFDVRIFRLICMVATVAAIVGMSRMLGYSVWAGLTAVVLLTYRFQPLLSDIRVANVNQIQLGLLALFLFALSRRDLRTRSFLGGLILGFAVAAKPNLLFVAAMLFASWLINRKFRKTLAFATGMAAAAAVAVIASSIVFGSFSCWTAWLKILPQASDYRYTIQDANYAPAMLLFSRFGIKVSFFLAILFFGTATAGLLAGRLARGNVPAADDRERELLGDILMTAMGCLIYLLSASLAWLHYFILTIPMLLILFRPGKRSGELAASAPLGLVLAAVSYLLIAELPLRFLLSTAVPYRNAMSIGIGTCILYGLGIWETLRLGRPSEADARAILNHKPASAG